MSRSPWFSRLLVVVVLLGLVPPLAPVGADARERDRPAAERSDKRAGGARERARRDVDVGTGLNVDAQCRPAEEADDTFFCDGQLVVALAPEVNIATLNAAIQSTIVASIPGRNIHLVALPPGTDEAAVLRILEANPLVRWAELNSINDNPEGKPNRFFPTSDSAPVPSEVQLSYGRDLIGAAPPLCVDGTGTVVAVVDTGIDADHPAVASRLASGWNAFTAQPGSVADRGNGRDDDGDGLIDEAVGHGTHVAGTVLQAAPNTRILPIKALNSDGAGQAFVVARAIYHAIDRKASVINLSLGAPEESRVIREAVREALAARVVVVAAAGNGGPGAPVEYPAASDGVLAVAASDEADVGAPFSTAGPRVDLSAPGVAIASAYPLGLLPTPYATASGTSMATPWVSAAAALLLDERPDRRPRRIGELLREAADPLAGPADGFGAGRLDVRGALDCGDRSANGD